MEYQIELTWEARADLYYYSAFERKIIVSAIRAQLTNLLCNVYHHLDNPTAYFSKAKEALKANGRVAIIDFYHDDRSGKLGFPKHHLVPREQVIEQMKQAGLTFLRDHTFLPRQYFLEFVGASSP